MATLSIAEPARDEKTVWPAAGSEHKGTGVGAFGKLVILLTCWKLGNKSAWATWHEY